MPTQATCSQEPSFQPEPVHAERGGHAFGTTHLAEHELKAWPAGGVCTAPDQLPDVPLAEAPVEPAGFFADVRLSVMILKVGVMYWVGFDMNLFHLANWDGCSDLSGREGKPWLRRSLLEAWKVSKSLGSKEHGRRFSMTASASL